MKREEQELKNTWDLNAMYNPDNLDKDIAIINKEVDSLVTFKDINFTKDVIIEVLNKYYDLLIKIENIYVYYSHQLDTDFNNSEYIAQSNYIKQVYNDISIKLSFIIPKISKVDNSILESIINDTKLSDFHKSIKDIMHNKKRYLSEEQEQIIASYSLTSSGPYQVFSAFSNADLKFNDVLDSNNNNHELTEGTYSLLIRSNDQTLRKNAFNELLKGYAKYNQTLATTYILELKDALINMRNRHFSSTLEQALEPNQIDIIIYHNLLNSIENNISINHQYMDLRKKELNLSQLHLYDVYVPMVDEVDTDYSFEQAKSIVKEALKIMPLEYQEVIDEAFNNRWIDVYENDGKRSGAYSGGSYKSYPYMLLNYHNNINDVFTLAHELGHSIHSYFSNKNNSYQNANYKIFVAEIASTVNELILINYLLNNEEDVKIKKYLLNYLLEQFRTTLIRQTMFARFELVSHQLVEDNKPISNEVLNELYLNINKEYFGTNIIIDDIIKYEYTRIPHFYYNYYVYQYATSFSIALNIVNRILNKEDKIIEKYVNFLKLGDSVLPVDAIATLDINLKDSKVFDNAMQEYAHTIELFKNVR
ncbi:MAG: oligoendopeptidase F [Bacilli bacterium]|jgi:oligoendopeptidase F|nr:oligoendopeptidase F [Bacilli bacterium]